MSPFKLGKSPIIYAAEHGHHDLVEYIIKHKIDLNKHDKVICFLLLFSGRSRKQP